MDPPPSATAASSAASSKLRLMCSYGGHIFPRPHTKSLYYAGGDTRIISIPTATANLTLSSLTGHLASALHVNNPFNLKYQLPDHDLDSLISLSTDEDLLNMLDEHHRLSPAPARIRLFLFPRKLISSPLGLNHLNTCTNVSELSGNELTHPKTESWFEDVLKSAMQKGGMGFGGEGQSEGNNGGCGGGEVSGGGLCGSESMVLETSSSFGSTSSSVSLSNFPAKGQVEDHGVGLLDNKVKLPSSESFASDNSVTTAASHPQSVMYQDPVAPVQLEHKIYMTPSESERKILDPPTGVEMHKTFQVSAFPLSLQFDQPQVQFVQTAASHYVPQNPTGMMPMSSYYLMSSPVSQQQMYYHTNPLSPVYIVPVGHPYNLPMQSRLVTPSTVSSNRPPAHPNPCHAQVAYKIAAATPVPEKASQVYRTLAMATSHINVPHNENHQQAGGLPQRNDQSEFIGITSTENANYTTEIDDDPVRVQIYKSQPPPPTLPSQYQTMTKATAAVMLSDALAQLHTDSTNQQLRTTLPQ